MNIIIEVVATDRFHCIGIPMSNIRRYRDRLIFNMRIRIHHTGKYGLYIESEPLCIFINMD